MIQPDILSAPYLERIGEEFDFPLFEGTPRVYIVLGLDRSGTTVICEGLYSSGLAGNPHEYEIPGQNEAFHKRWETTDSAVVLQKLFAHRTSPNGIFGMKVLAKQLGHAKLLPLINAYYSPAYVLILRRDKLNQAISKVKALMSKEYSSSIHTCVRKLRIQDYNFYSIANAMLECVYEEMLLLNYINIHKYTKKIFFYEDFQDDPRTAIGEILRSVLGQDVSDESVNIQHMKKQKNELSEYYRQKFLSDFPTLGASLHSEQVEAIKAALRNCK